MRYQSHDAAPADLLRGGLLGRAAHAALLPGAHAFLALAVQAGGQVLADVELGRRLGLVALRTHLVVAGTTWIVCAHKQGAASIAYCKMLLAVSSQGGLSSGLLRPKPCDCMPHSTGIQIPPNMF